MSLPNENKQATNPEAKRLVIKAEGRACESGKAPEVREIIAQGDSLGYRRKKRTSPNGAALKKSNRQAQIVWNAQVSPRRGFNEQPSAKMEGRACESGKSSWPSFLRGYRPRLR